MRVSCGVRDVIRYDEEDAILQVRHRAVMEVMLFLTCSHAVIMDVWGTFLAGSQWWTFLIGGRRWESYGVCVYILRTHSLCTFHLLKEEYED